MTILCNYLVSNLHPFERVVDTCKYTEDKHTHSASELSIAFCLNHPLWTEQKSIHRGHCLRAAVYEKDLWKHRGTSVIQPAAWSLSCSEIIPFTRVEHVALSYCRLPGCTCMLRMPWSMLWFWLDNYIPAPQWKNNGEIKDKWSLTFTWHRAPVQHLMKTLLLAHSIDNNRPSFIWQ